MLCSLSYCSYPVTRARPDSLQPHWEMTAVGLGREQKETESPLQSQPPAKSLRTPEGTRAESEGVNALRRVGVNANVCHNSSAACGFIQDDLC